MRKLIQPKDAQGPGLVSIYHDFDSGYISLCKWATMKISLKFYFKAIKSFGSLRTVRDIVPYNCICRNFIVSGFHKVFQIYQELQNW